jgi:hypothetical protein
MILSYLKVKEGEIIKNNISPDGADRVKEEVII